MKLIEKGILSYSEPGTRRANLIFASVLPLSNGTLLGTCRAGSTKDSDDFTIEVYHSRDGGRTWSPPRRCFGEVRVNGVRGVLWACYFTELAPGHLIAACMWVDRETYPGKPCFNPETEGCLPAAILLADSYDFGETWTPWRVVPMPDEIGPPSLTNPILKLADGTLALSVETNKQYEDRSKWYQKVVLFHSSDLGRTWTGPITAGQDPTGRIYNWDQRLGVTPDGRIAAFLMTYDSETHTYLNIHRRISSDGGRTWSAAEDLGFSEQAAHPAMLPDGRVVLAWVDRYGTHSIRARVAQNVAAPFDAATEVVVYAHNVEMRRDSVHGSTTADLTEQLQWTYGLPHAEALPDGDVLVVHYAGTPQAMDIHWVRLRI